MNDLEPVVRWSRRTHGLASRDIDDEAVVLDTQQRVYHALNPAGSLLWGLLEAGADQQDLVTALTQRYDVSELDATADVRAFLDALATRDLVTEQQ